MQVTKHKIRNYLLNTDDPENTSFIHVGDGGIGMVPEWKVESVFTDIDRDLEPYNCNFIAVRGNHDDPSYFPSKYGENIYLVPDYFQTDGVLFVGGAISPDRDSREIGVDYWEDEGFKSDIERASSIYGVAHVVTHAAPHFIYPISRAPSDLNFKDRKVYETYRRAHHERLLITFMYRKLLENNALISWHYGHYHKAASMYCPEKVKFVCVPQEKILPHILWSR